MKIFQFHFAPDNSMYWVYAPTLEEAIDKMVEYDYMAKEDPHTATEIPREEWIKHDVINYSFDSDTYVDACDVPESEWEDGIPPEQTFEEFVQGLDSTEVLCSTEFDGM